MNLVYFVVSLSSASSRFVTVGQGLPAPSIPTHLHQQFPVVLGEAPMFLLRGCLNIR